MTDPAVGALATIGGCLLCLACFGWNQPRIAAAIEHWGHAIGGLAEPSDLFYARVYQRLKQRLDEAGLPDSRIGFGSGHLFGNRTVFGAHPQYLIVRYLQLTIYVYAFPLPYGLYVSYWAFSQGTFWDNLPPFCWLRWWRENHMTLYQFDVTDMCLLTINSALHEVIDEYCDERGLKPLEEFERRPVLQSFYAKYKQGSLAPGGYVMPLPPSGPAPLPAAPLPAAPGSAAPVAVTPLPHAPHPVSASH